MLRVQNKISTGVQALHHYLNFNFRFKTQKYYTAMAKLSDADREIFYDNLMVT